MGVLERNTHGQSTISLGPDWAFIAPKAPSFWYQCAVGCDIVMPVQESTVYDAVPKVVNHELVLVPWQANSERVQGLMMELH